MAVPLETSAAQVSPEEVRQTLAKITQSKYFAHAPKKQKFVQVIGDYYLQGRAAELNEYLIGYEVFDKGTEYHPSADPVVRVSAHDVRKKLETYYQHEGALDPVRMTVPVGTYVPVFSRVTVSPAGTEVITPPPVAAPAEEPVPSAPIEPPRPLLKPRPTINPKLLGAGVVMLCLLAALAWLWSQNRALQQRGAAVPPEHEQEMRQGIWASFLSNKVSTLLVLSNPVVFRTVHGADPDVVSKKGINLTSEQADLLTNASNNRLPIRPNQKMQLIPAFNMYTGLGEAIGAYRLYGLLNGMGEATALKQSRSIGADDLKDHDVILLGSVYSNQWSTPVSIQEKFVYSNHASIENLSPQPGEAREYAPSFDPRTGALLEDYAVITVVPGVSGTNTFMFLAGIFSEGTQAAAEYVTDPTHLAALRQRLAQGKTTLPRYFQALLKVRVENSFPTQVTLLIVREL